MPHITEYLPSKRAYILTRLCERVAAARRLAEHDGSGGLSAAWDRYRLWQHWAWRLGA